MGGLVDTAVELAMSMRRWGVFFAGKLQTMGFRASVSLTRLCRAIKQPFIYNPAAEAALGSPRPYLSTALKDTKNDLRRLCI